VKGEECPVYGNIPAFFVFQPCDIGDMIENDLKRFASQAAVSVVSHSLAGHFALPVEAAHILQLLKVFCYSRRSVIINCTGKCTKKFGLA
jgi:hypothetical protein